MSGARLKCRGHAGEVAANSQRELKEMLRRHHGSMGFLAQIDPVAAVLPGPTHWLFSPGHVAVGSAWPKRSKGMSPLHSSVSGGC